MSFVQSGQAGVPRLDDANTTTTALSGAATYTGGWTDVGAYTYVTVAAKADVAGTLYMEFTNDATQANADSTLTYDVAANINEVHTLKRTRRYYRTRYLNGSSAQSSFEISTFLDQSSGLLVAPANLTLGQDADAIAVRAIEGEQDIAEGKRAGYSIVNKFGSNDAVTTVEDVWSGGGVYTGFPTGSAELVTVSSSVSGDDSDFEVTIYGLDANGALQSEAITLDGTNLVDSANTYTRVFRGVITASGTSNTEFTAGTITCAHKTTTANVFFVMPAGVNQSRVGAYTIPAGKTGYLRQFDVEMAKSNNATATGGLWVRENGAPPRVIRNFTIGQTSPYNTNIYGGLVFPALTDVAVRILTVSSGTLQVTTNFDIVLVDN